MVHNEGNVWANVQLLELDTLFETLLLPPLPTPLLLPVPVPLQLNLVMELTLGHFPS